MSIHTKALNEYRFFLTYHLFPLLGISHKAKDLKIIEHKVDYMGSPIVKCANKLYFSTDKQTVFELDYDDLTDDNKSLAINILQVFFRVAKYHLTSEKELHNMSYYSDVQKESNYKMAIQKGICNWIVGKNNLHVEKLFDILEKWSVKTYEGKKVTFGFIINPDATSFFDNSRGSWCDFLDDDFSAVLTDCINSVIELDSKCNFVRYISLTDPNLTPKDPYGLDDTLPYRFSEIIKKHVQNNAVGVFLLNNGDIIISKNKSIKFVKRNLKWLNFNFDAFKNSLIPFCEENNINDDVIRGIFASILDVSFAHTGGIISIIADITKLTKAENDGFPILSPCDYLQNELSLDELAMIINQSSSANCASSEISEKEINKRLLKRNVIKTLVNRTPFINLDRKLRCELISLDGACILDTNGNVCSFGAIIKNDSGSSGGGRGAATKKLSNYGIAVKISTDGYIELFISGEPTYSIK